MHAHRHGSSFTHGHLAAPPSAPDPRKLGRPLSPAIALLALATSVLASGGCHSHSDGSSVTRSVDPAPGAGPTVPPGPDAAGARPDGAGDASAADARPPLFDPTACQEAVCCVGPQCPKRAAGIPCQTADQCETGFCADGVCCNVACQGACMACNQADRMGECLPTAVGAPDPHLICRHDEPATCGQSGVCNGEGGCAKHNAGVPCGEPRCNDGTAMMPASECDGNGTCVAGEAVACAPFTCEGQSCRVTCTSDSQCLPPRVCSNGSCGKRGPGQTCGAAEQCESGFCVDGVCCENACAGRCTTCASARARGKCVPVPAGNADLRALAPGSAVDPAQSCADQGPQSCGANGRCDGKGGCEIYRDNTICAPGSCEATTNQGTAPSVCRAGRCEHPAGQTCAPFVGCSGNRCSTSCDDDRDCSAGNVCTAGSCGKRPIGSVCSRGDECAGPGICAQGRCCSASCNRACTACNLEGQIGTCAPVPTGGADPGGACRNDACNNGCDGAGSCRRERAGTTCGAASCAAAGSAVTTRSCTAEGICASETSPCPDAQACTGNRCAPIAKKNPGDTCTAAGDCQSGACLGGRCCAGACDGDCRTCEASSQWRCMDRPDDSACPGKQICREGRCVPPTPGCPLGRILCGKGCVDLRADADNCSTCGHRCESRLCEKGVCVPLPVGPPPCPAKQIRCGNGCVDAGSSAQHCGACDHGCPAVTPACVSGKCVAADKPAVSK
jgi:hypothetical protein